MTCGERKKIRRLTVALVVVKRAHVALRARPPADPARWNVSRHWDTIRLARHVLRHTPPELLAGFLGADADPVAREFVILNLDKS